MSVSKIRVGAYGAPGAGKTMFFWQLVRGNQLPVQPGSKLAQFIQAATGPDGQIVPTTATFENIEIKIDNVSYYISDWKGDFLAESLSRLDMESRRGRSRNVIAKQTLRNDTFFFFFDPTGQAEAGRLLKHHRDELLRAKQLIDHVLASRENRLLPILFILGHEDRLAKDPETLRLTEKWIDEVNDYLGEAFDEQLFGYYPRQFVRKENIFHRISCTDSSHASDLIGIMDRARSLVELAYQFRKRDRKRSFRLVFLFLFSSLLLLILPFLCLTSPAVKDAFLQLRNQAAPVFGHFPGLSLKLDSSEERELESSLNGLLEPEQELDDEKAKKWNHTLFLLMRHLNKLEDTGKAETDDYKVFFAHWNKAFERIERRLDQETVESPEEKLNRFSILLASLTDSPKRSTKPLNDVLQKYWVLTRQTILNDLKNDLADHRAAGSSSKRILDELCRKLEDSFRSVSESKVRGDIVPKGVPGENKKDSLKQDLRKAFIACRNYSERFQIEVKIIAATLESQTDIDRDIHRRLVFFGGKEKGEVDIDLTISSGFQSATACSFLPSRREFSISGSLDQPLHLAVQGKPKGSQGEWGDIVAWNIEFSENQGPSLKSLGVSFYQRYENDENISYYPEGKGYKFELTIRRPQNVPEFLWEIVAETK